MEIRSQHLLDDGSGSGKMYTRAFWVMTCGLSENVFSSELVRCVDVGLNNLCGLRQSY